MLHHWRLYPDALTVSTQALTQGMIALSGKGAEGCRNDNHIVGLTLLTVVLTA